MSKNTPKTEEDNGSDPEPTKTKPYTWPSLAKPMKLPHPHPQKRSVRPLFSILLLIVFAATVSFRAVLRRADVNLSLSLGAWSPQKKTHARSFNSTLLKYASVDISEPRARREIEQLLEGNFASQPRYRTFATWRRFDTHLDPRARSSNSIPVLLRSPRFYRYWLQFRTVLHDWVRKKTSFDPEIMSDLIRSVKLPLTNNSNSKRYSSCAVVGNSGILLKSEYGELIDSHEFVVRLNNARTTGFQRNVGSKTSVSFVNSNILHFCARRDGCFCHPYGVDVPIVMYICQPVHFMDYTLCNSTHKAALIVTDPRFDVLCARIVKYYSLKRFAEETGKSLDDWGVVRDGANFHYSSGMQAVMMALGVCDKVSVFGFGKSSLAKHHYHTNQKAELGLHDYEAEYAFYQDVIERPWKIPFISSKFKFPPMVIYQ